MRNQFTDIGLIPPQAIEIEENLLGAMLIIRETVDVAKSLIIPEMFYKDSNRMIYETIIATENPDILTVTQKLKADGNLEKVGGAYVITTLANNHVFGSVDEWCAIIKQKYSRREAIRIGMKLQQIGFDDSRDELDSFTEIDLAHQKLSDLLFGQTKVSTFSEIAAESLVELDDRITKSRTGLMPGIPTGINILNKTLGGWIPGDLIVLAARPGMGKTALALHFLKSAASHNKQVYFFSLEMTLSRLMDRLIVGGTNISNFKYKMGYVSDLEREQVHTWVSKNNMPMWMDDRSMVSVDYIISKCRVMGRKQKLDMVIIDYLQLIDMKQEKGQTRDMAIGLVTRKLKALAKEMKVPVILLSQLNRAVEARADKRGTLADLRESGNIEQDADIVLFPYRPAYYGIETHNGKDTSGMTVTNVAKHRNGESNVDVEFYHNESLTNYFDERTDDNMPF